MWQNEKVDVYSFAVMCWELLSGRIPFEDVAMLEVGFAVRHVRVTTVGVSARGPGVSARGPSAAQVGRGAAQGAGGQRQEAEDQQRKEGRMNEGRSEPV